MIQFINKNGDIIRLVKPYRKKTYERKTYSILTRIHSGAICDQIKAINGYVAILKFCIKHPIVLFYIK